MYSETISGFHFPKYLLPEKYFFSEFSKYYQHRYMYVVLYKILTKWHCCSVYLWLHVFCQLCLPFHPYCLDCSIPYRLGYPQILGPPTLRCLDHHLLPPKNVRVYISFTYPNVIIIHALIYTKMKWRSQDILPYQMVLPLSFPLLLQNLYKE